MSDSKGLYKVHLSVWGNVPNPAGISLHPLSSKIDGLLSAGLVDPTLVFDRDQLLFAIHKSLFAHRNDVMKTKSVHSEILYSLSPSRSIGEAHKKFGFFNGPAPPASGAPVIAVVVTDEGSTSDDACVRDLLKSILAPGVESDVDFSDGIAGFREVEQIRRCFKISDAHRADSDVSNFILCKIAVKDYI